uniref:Flocculation protein FLO11-like n=1 Tax=Mesocestoides corti TaxID=53468 RepID=A0A5K3FRW7_MESCO
MLRTCGVMNIGQLVNEAASNKGFSAAHSTFKSPDQRSPLFPQDTVGDSDSNQQEVNCGDAATALEHTSPDTTTPSSTAVNSDPDQDKVLAEVVEAAKARDLAKIFNLVTSWRTPETSSMSSVNPPVSQSATSSTTTTNGPTELSSLPEGNDSMISSIQANAETSQPVVSETTAAAAPVLPTNSSAALGVTDVCPPSALSSSSAQSHPLADKVDESKTSPSSTIEEPPKDNPQPINELISPPTESTVMPCSVALPTSSWAASAPPVVAPTTPLTSTISVSLSVLNAAGELSPVHVLLPNQPLVVLRVMPIQGARAGEQVTLSIPTQLILKNISSAIESGASYNGGPIIIPITPPPINSITASTMTTDSIVKSVTAPIPPALPIGLKSSASSSSSSSGARKMRAIAPKPSNSVVGTVPVTSVSTSLRSTGSRPARKIFASPVVPTPLTQATSVSTMPPASTPISTPVAFIGGKPHAAAILRKPNASNSPLRNRSRRKNPSTSLPPPVTVAAPATATIAPPSGGYIIDPTSGALIPADAGSTGGFIQPMVQSGPSAPQFFAPPGSFFVSTSNGIIPMPISGVLPADAKAPEAPESGELIAGGGNPYQSGFLVPADGSNEAFTQPVFFANGAGPNGQFILPSYQTSVPGGEYVQPFSAQPTEYLQANGGELYLASDGSSYMSYPSLIGQPQPVATVDLKDDGSGVDVASDNDDIINIAMRVACGEQVMCLPADVDSGAGAVATSTVEVTDETNGVISEFIQSSSISRPPSNAVHEEQPGEQASPLIEESVVPSDQQTSTGDAKIDALLAEAALVSSVNGVGDNQSAVSVPVASLLGPRTTAPSTTTNPGPCAIVDASAADVHEFSQSLYESFANFDASLMPETAPISCSKAATEAAFTFVTQKVRDLDSVFGPDSTDLDATTTHVTDSFLNSLVNQADDLDAEMANKENPLGASLSLVSHPVENKDQPNVGPQDDQEGSVNEMEVSQVAMADLFQLSFGRHVDDAVVGDADMVEDDDTFFPFPRDYTTSEQFDEALQLLGSPPPSNCSPPRVPDDIEGDDGVSVVGGGCDGAPFIQNSASAPKQAPNSNSKPPSPEVVEQKVIEDVVFNEAILPHELSVGSDLPSASPVTDRQAAELSLFGEGEKISSPTEGLPKTDNMDEDEDAEDDSGSELDFLPSRNDRNQREQNESPPFSPKDPPSSPQLLLATHAASSADGPRRSSRSIAVKATSLSPTPQQPIKYPKHSTPRTKRTRRQSFSSLLSPPILPRRRSQGDASSTPVSPRQLRSAAAAKKDDSPVYAEDASCEDISPLKAPTTREDLKKLDRVQRASQRRSGALVLEDSDDAGSSKLSLDSSQHTECCVEESTIACTVETPTTPKRKRGRPSLRSSGEPAASPSSPPKDPVVSASDATPSNLWTMFYSRPTSFGFSRDSNVHLPLPNTNIQLNVELRDHPALTSDQSFWGDPEETFPAEDDDEDDKKDAEDKTTHSESPTEKINGDAVVEADSPPSPPSPELLATVTAVSIALNLPVTPAIALPGNGTAFAKFAASMSLPSFGEFTCTTQPTSTIASIRDGEKDSQAKKADCNDDGDSEATEGSTSPVAWLRDSKGLAFSENLFPPRFAAPLSPSPLAAGLQVPVISNCEANQTRGFPLISPTKSPAFGDSPNPPQPPISLTSPSSQTFGSFAGAAAFRSSSFSSLAARASSRIFGASTTTTLPATSFSEIAKAAETQHRDLHGQLPTPFRVASTVSSADSDTCDTGGSSPRPRSKASRRSHPYRRHKVNPSRLSPHLHHAVEMQIVDTLQQVTTDESLAPREHSPLQFRTVPYADFTPPSALAVASCFPRPPPQSHQLPPLMEIIDLPQPPSNSSLADGLAHADNSTAASPTESRQPIRIKLKLPIVKSRHKSRGEKRRRKREHSEEPVANSKTFRSPTILRLSRVGGMFRTEAVSAPQAPPHKTSNSAPTAPPKRPTTFAPPIWAAGRRGRGGFRTGGGGTSSSSSANARVSSAVASGTSAPAAGTGALSKKFFSSSKEDRRSSAIKTTRPWRLGFGSPPRKRGGFSGKSDRGSGNFRRTSSSTSVQNTAIEPPPPPPPVPVNPIAPQVPTPTNNRIRVVIRLPKEDDSAAGHGQVVTGINDHAQDHEEEGVVSVSECATEEEEEEEEEDGEEVNESTPGPQFSIAPVAETFVDKNQARVRVVRNRALFSAGEVIDEDDRDSSFSSDELPPTNTRGCLPSINGSQSTHHQSNIGSGQSYHNQQVLQPGISPASRPSSVKIHPELSTARYTTYSPPNLIYGL